MELGENARHRNRLIASCFELHYIYVYISLSLRESGPLPTECAHIQTAAYRIIDEIIRKSLKHQSYYESQCMENKIYFLMRRHKYLSEVRVVT